MYGALKQDFFQLDEVTAAYRISRHHLAKVVHKLARQGYLETRRGRGGGIRLAMRPEDVRIGALVRSSECHPPMVECFDRVHNTCRIDGACRLKGALAEALNAFYASLDRYSLHDLVSGPHRSEMSKILLVPKR